MNSICFFDNDEVLVDSASTFVFPEVPEMLRRIKRLGFSLAVASANPNKKLMLRIFGEAGICDYFSRLEDGFALEDKIAYMRGFFINRMYSRSSSVVVSNSPSDMVYAKWVGLGIRIAFNRIPHLTQELHGSPYTDLVCSHIEVANILTDIFEKPATFQDSLGKMFNPDPKIII